MSAAERNLRAARYNLEGGFIQAAAFFAQQAVEKALKALHAERGGRIPRVHDLVFLAEQMKAPSEVLELCQDISPAYVATRYPDAARRITRRRAERLVREAQRC